MESAAGLTMAQGASATAVLVHSDYIVSCCEDTVLGYVQTTFLFFWRIMDAHSASKPITHFTFGMKILRVSIDDAEFSAAVSREWSCQFLTVPCRKTTTESAAIFSAIEQVLPRAVALLCAPAQRL